METQPPPPDASVLQQLVSANGGTPRRILISGATVLTMDPDVGNYARGDILIEDGKIAAIREDLSEAASDARAIRIEAAGRIAIPGLQDTHRHCWQNQLRRLIPDCDDNKAYLDVTHNWLGQLYRPEDIYVGNLISALGAIETGTTCVLDFFHNARTPEHSDAAIMAFRDAGIRSVHVSCGPLTGEWDHSWPADVKRIRDQYFNSTDQLSTLRLGAIGAEFAPEHIALNRERVRSAGELGIDFVSDGVVGPPCSRKIHDLAEAELLGPHLTLIHCLDLSDDAWRPSLSVDVEVCLTSDMFTQMRTLYSIQRMRVFERRYQGLDYAAPVGVKDILEFATVAGARANGVLDRAGTLTPGKDADLVLINANDYNTMPLNNAYGSIVSAADTRNVETVFIAGEVKKFAGEVVGWDKHAIMRRVYGSRDYLLDTAGFDLDIFEQRVGFLAPDAQPSLRPQ
jgi:cytosine/adenosine deaminase-related metal-dependent hydrolase